MSTIAADNPYDLGTLMNIEKPLSWQSAMATAF
jgi:hypothetical protein